MKKKYRFNYNNKKHMSCQFVNKKYVDKNLYKKLVTFFYFTFLFKNVFLYAF